MGYSLSTWDIAGFLWKVKGRACILSVDVAKEDFAALAGAAGDPAVGLGDLDPGVVGLRIAASCCRAAYTG